ncbi:MAG: 4Fe-4S dicluster domain-containing protein [Actinomycetota bacterium]|nr:4Fe-4S dicluster domain-containing protein [Actinomycetota bacterium]
MDETSAVDPLDFIDLEGLAALLAELTRRGYRLIGPTVDQGAISLRNIAGVDDLPRGVGEEQEAGTYRLVRRNDDLMFGWAHGPQSGKGFLFPSRELVSVASRREGRLEFQPPPEEEPPFAFIGLRSCDLHAIEVQDRTFLDRDPAYTRRRRSAFFIGVNCSTPGGTCFCTSMGTGPRCTLGFDLALTELGTGFTIQVGSQAGAEMLKSITNRPATSDETEASLEVTRRAERSMGRSLDTSDLPDLLYRNPDSPRWTDVANRCLSCTNCTMVCPTCFCHDVVDASDLLGQEATRTREWASCFSEEHSHIVGGPVRTTGESRYRQWLTHKFASWIDQFGTSGCIGCGRCITWCPVGIDVTEEISAIRDLEQEARVDPEVPPS